MNEVNMCHGSKCMNDEKKYKPYVAASEMTISRRAWFVATSLVGNDKPSHQHTQTTKMLTEGSPSIQRRYEVQQGTPSIRRTKA